MNSPIKSLPLSKYWQNWRVVRKMIRAFSWLPKIPKIPTKKGTSLERTWNLINSNYKNICSFLYKTHHEIVQNLLDADYLIIDYWLPFNLCSFCLTVYTAVNIAPLPNSPCTVGHIQDRFFFNSGPHKYLAIDSWHFGILYSQNY